MNKDPQEKINRFQDSLPTLRKVAGWSAEDLANSLDVTRQTIVNLETGQTKMTKIQYMAIRLAFEEEAQETNNETLSKLISILVDSDDLDEKHRGELKETVDTAANSVGRRAGAAAAGKAAAAAAASILAGSAFLPLGPLGLAVGVVAASVVGGMSRFSDTKKGGSDQ